MLLTCNSLALMAVFIRDFRWQICVERKGETELINTLLNNFPFIYFYPILASLLSVATLFINCNPHYPIIIPSVITAM